jgi:ketol-acid reductoisomerase
LIKPPRHVDVVMVAPKAPGKAVREEFLAGRGVPALVAVHQDYSGSALKYALALAKGIGATRAGVIETTFAEPLIVDLTIDSEIDIVLPWVKPGDWLTSAVLPEGMDVKLVYEEN